jgi:hypothetical protein
MSGRRGRNNVRGGCGHGGAGRGGRGQGRGQNYTGSADAERKGICTNLDTNVLDYGHKSAADQMQSSWEKLVQYVSTNYGQDISNELQNSITLIIVEPVHTDDGMARHGVRVVMIQSGQMKIQRALKSQEKILQAQLKKAKIWTLR